MAAIGFGIYAAYNAQGAIAGIIDPMGNGTMPVWLYLVIGAAISIVGMLFGHFIYEGLTEGFNTDEYTGAKSPSSKLWLAVVGFIGAISYVVYQFLLVKFAGNGNTTMAYMPYVVAGIAILELLIGGLILHKAFAYILLFIISITMTLISRQMDSNAKSTNDNYREYLTFVNAYNKETTTERIEVEGNGNIRKAIAYYTGTYLQEGNTENNNNTNNMQENRTSKNQTENVTTNNNGTTTNQETSEQKQKNQEKLDSFMNVKIIFVQWLNPQ